ncbi:MAG: thioesterase, partial [Lentisphaeria bacterium]|nr:thioesterase [Lentisphaeria bacterium]
SAVLLKEVMPDNSALPITFPSLGKLPAASAEAKCRTHHVTATQIDINGHLNNTEYASILQDTLGIGVYPAEFQLNYQKGVPPESDIQISGQRDASGEFVFTGRVDDNVVFEAAGNILNIEEGENVYGL